MAERINWQAFNNQVINNMPAGPEWQRVINNIYQHPFATKIRDGAVNAATAWWNNVNPRQFINKDAAWRIGFAVGLVESTAFMYFVPGGGLIKAGVNLGVTQLGHYVAYRNPTWEPSIRSGLKGFSAGGTYGSLGLGLLGGVLNEGYQGLVNTRISASEAPRVQLPDIGKAINNIVHPSPISVSGIVHEPYQGPFGGHPIFDTGVNTATETATPPTITIPRPEIPNVPPIPNIEAIISAKTAVIESDLGFKEALAAKVGEKLPLEDTIINNVMEAHGKSISDLSPESLQAAREAVQHAMENQANISADSALHDLLISNPNLGTTYSGAINLTKNAATTRFDHWFNQTDSQSFLTGVANKAIQEQQAVSPDQFAAKVAKFVAENKDNHSLITEHIVQPGETAGHLVLQMDAPVNWTGADWQGFAALYSANPEAFSSLRSAMGLNAEQFAQLMYKVQIGDHDAYRQMIEYMGKIQAGKKIIMFTPAGLKRLLAA